MKTTKEVLQWTIENENSELERLAEAIEKTQADVEKMSMRYHEHIELRDDLVKSLNALNNVFPVAENT